MEFSHYSLVLYKENKILYKSKKRGLIPLLECVKKNKELTECSLYDKVVGLGAARIIIYSNISHEVNAGTISRSAKKLLEKNNINVDSESIVENIRNRDNSDICPFEKKAMEIQDNEEYFIEVSKLLKQKHIK